MKLFNTLNKIGLSLVAFAAPTIVWAQGLQGSQNLLNQVAVPLGGAKGDNYLPNLIGQIINVILGFLGIILLGYLLYAGFLWMTAGGDDKKVTEAKTMIRNAIVGIIIIIAAVAISSFVINALVNATSKA